MTRPKLLLRNLTHFRLANLAVIAGTAIATAVLTGALMVGDSVRGSLKDLALQRLGPVDHALVSNRFFNQDLATRLSARPAYKSFHPAVPAILIRGGASDEQAAHHTGGVQVNAIGGHWLGVPRGQALINSPVASELALKGDSPTILINVPLPDDQPRDSALARRGREQSLTSLRLTARTTSESFANRFSLAGTQRTPRNIWLNLPELQSTLERPRQVNALLVSAKASSGANPNSASDELWIALKEALNFEDYGLSLTHSPEQRQVIVSSSTTYLTPPVLQAIESTAPPDSLQKISVYLINHITRSSTDGQTQAHYAIAAGIDHIDNQPLASDEVILNQWMADTLKAKVGDKLKLDYYQRQPNGDLVEVSSDRAGLTFTIKKILPMTGMGADPSLTPSYKGLTDADSIADWQAPAGLDIDKKLITQADEDYWDKYKAAPKLFISLDSARRLWGSALGDINSVRISVELVTDDFRAKLLNELDPQAAGLVFKPIKQQQLAAATTGTDFSGLFVGLSFFIIASAAMLVAMLFRLAVEQRARQFGLLGALGFTPRTLRRLAILEGLILAAIGALLGVGLAIAYTALMILGLRTWWVGAVGTTALHLHVYPLTLIIGLASSMLIALCAAAWGAWRLGKTEAASLLAGAFATRIKTTGRRIAPIAAITCAIIALALNAAGALNLMDQKSAFMAGGAFLLIAGLFAVAAAFNRRPRITTSSTHWSLPRLGLRNAGRNRARSVLTVGLIAFASFVLVSVSAFKQSPPPDSRDKTSGTGGYQLILTADVPLLGDLSTEKGRDVLAIQDTKSLLWSKTNFLSMRSWAGQDMSCLNLTRPTQPTILAVPDSLTQRGAFAKSDENPWPQLDAKQDDNTIPVLADHEAATYILKLGVGQTLDIHDQLGRPRKLKLVATLNQSIFQSELLMSESNFRELFPSQSGFGTVLIETPDPDATRNLLSKELADYAVTIEPTTERLARYQQVANTYISTFQTLGSLGLLLGTIGLAVILLRGLVERRAELALLAAIGFTGARRLTLVLAENALLLVLGLVVGTLCALIGIAPALFTSGRAINTLQLSLTLGAVLLTGLLVLVLTLLVASRRITPADLRAE